MSSAKNHARRSRRGFHLQKSITGGYAAKTWVKTTEKMRQQEKSVLSGEFGGCSPGERWDNRTRRRGGAFEAPAVFAPDAQSAGPSAEVRIW